jgi:hypothetical protein
MKDSEMKRMREAKEVAGERAVDFSLDAPPLPDDERIAHARRNGYAARRGASRMPPVRPGFTTQ